MTKEATEHLWGRPCGAPCVPWLLTQLGTQLRGLVSGGGGNMPAQHVGLGTGTFDPCKGTRRSQVSSCSDARVLAAGTVGRASES